METWNHHGVLYIVATPIGNLNDMTPRAVEILQQVDVIAAEDTRHSLPLMHHFNINTPLIAYHDHNERSMTPILIERLRAGESIALISDAGTPLLSDPGFQLVRAAHEQSIPVTPIPGANAGVCALSAAGLPCERFIFEGFLPAKESARRTYLETLRWERRTLIFYEAPYRLQETIKDLAEIFGGERQTVLARELTKIHEIFLRDTLAGLQARVNADTNQRRGESVLIVAGASETEENARREAEAKKIFALLLKDLPASRAVSVAAKITGTPKNLLYATLISGNDN